MRRTPIHRVVPVAAALLWGCAGEAPEGPAAAPVVRDSAGVRIVDSPRPRVAAGEVVIDPDPSIRIGREESGPYQFGFVSDAAFLDDGTIAVAAAQSGEIRIFDPDGRHRTTFGRQGDGPGEFRVPTMVAGFGPDSIVAYDARLRRATIFPRAGGSPRTLPNSVEGNFSVFGVVGRETLLLFSPGGSYRPDLEPGGQWVETPVIAMDAASGASDTLAVLPDRWRVVDADGNAPMPQPLRYAVQAATANGFHWGTPDVWEVRTYDRDGDLVRIVRRVAEPRPVEPDMVGAYVAMRLEEVRLRQGEEAVAALRSRLEREEYLEELPYFSAAFVDRVDRLWVGMYAWPDPNGPVVWSVFDPDGAWLWEVESPGGLRLLDATSDRVLGVARDPLGVQSVHVHPILSEESG